MTVDTPQHSCNLSDGVLEHHIVNAHEAATNGANRTVVLPPVTDCQVFQAPSLLDVLASPEWD